jgi:hypothetical protein
MQFCADFGQKFEKLFEEIYHLHNLSTISLSSNPEVDWDQKTLVKFNTKNPKGPFLTFCIGDCKGFCDQRHITTMSKPSLIIHWFD